MAHYQPLSQDFIQDLLLRTDLVEVIRKQVTLQKSGTNYKACCPFHNEKTPSFHVNSAKQFYHCFGCGVSGNAIGFLMDYERLTFLEAVETLAHQAGISIPKNYSTANSAVNPQLPLYQLLENITQQYQSNLKDSPIALTYLQKRGVSDEMIQHFKIGFAKDAWDAVLRQFGNSAEKKAQLMQTGMLAKSEQGKVYDRFRNRLIIPILDARGRTIAFGGRTLGDDNPKYLNSPETPLFHKTHLLFGLYQAKQSQLDSCLVVEGYMDVIALHQFGITNVVATMGTALSVHHLEQLLRYTKHLIFCFDGDKAGRTAAARALETSLPVLRDGVQIQFMFLPQGHDPDSFVRKEGSDSFKQHIQSALPISDFFFQHLSQPLNLATPDGKASLVQLTKEPLSKLPEGVFRHLMIQKLAELVGMTEQMIERQLGGAAKTETEPTATAPGTLLPIVQSAIAMVLQYPDIARSIVFPPELKEIGLKNADIVLKLLELLAQHPDISTGGLLEFWRDTKAAPRLAKLATWKLLTPKEGIEAELSATFRRLIIQDREERIQLLKQKMNNGTISQEEKKLFAVLIKEKGFL